METWGFCMVNENQNLYQTLAWAGFVNWAGQLNFEMSLGVWDAWASGMQIIMSMKQSFT